VVELISRNVWKSMDFSSFRFRVWQWANFLEQDVVSLGFKWQFKSTMGGSDTMFLWLVAAIPYSFHPFDSLWSFLLATKTSRSLLEQHDLAILLLKAVGADWTWVASWVRICPVFGTVDNGSGSCVHLFLCLVRKVQHFWGKALDWLEKHKSCEWVLSTLSL